MSEPCSYIAGTSPHGATHSRIDGAKSPRRPPSTPGQAGHRRHQGADSRSPASELRRGQAPALSRRPRHWERQPGGYGHRTVWSKGAFLCNLRTRASWRDQTAWAGDRPSWRRVRTTPRPTRGSGSTGAGYPQATPRWPRGVATSRHECASALPCAVASLHRTKHGCTIGGSVCARRARTGCHRRNGGTVSWRPEY
jgi:hypothetical protein